MNGRVSQKKLVMISGGYFDPYLLGFDVSSGAAVAWFRETLMPLMLRGEFWCRGLRWIAPTLLPRIAHPIARPRFCYADLIRTHAFPAARTRRPHRIALRPRT